MKTIGLIGGMSWESTIPYYRHINETIKCQLGGLHSAKIVLFSVDFHEIERLQMQGDWAAAGELLAQAAQRLEAAGVDFIVICTNTMHKVYDQIVAAISIPVCHIADATADVITQQKIETVGLLGTRFTMEQDFYKARLSEQHPIKVIVPDEADRGLVHQVIYQELCLGLINNESREAFRQVMQRLVEKGAQGIILGCTEIGLLVDKSDASVPLFDTAKIHAVQAAEISLKP